MGFKAAPVSATESKFAALTASHAQAIDLWRHLFFMSLLFAAPLMIAMFVFMCLMQPMSDDANASSFKPNSSSPSPQIMLADGLDLQNALMFVLSTPVQLVVGRHFYIRAGLALREHTSNMDVLIALAIGVSYAYSIVVLVVAMATQSAFSPTTFFETAPMLLIFVSLGRWIEAKARERTSDALSTLLSLNVAQC